MITISDILNIDNCDLYFFDHYKEDKPVSNHLYWGELTPVYSPRKDGKITKEIIEDRLTNPEWKNNDLYLVCKYLQYGDYDNSCMVERSNHKSFLEDFKEESGVFTISGGYGSAGIAISVQYLLNQDNEKAQDIVDILNGLNDYPCIDDENMSNMEYDAFIEALNDYGIRDSMDALSKKFNLDINDYNEEQFKQLLLEKDSHLNYPCYEIGSGGICYIDTDRLIEKITFDELKPVLINYEVKTDD